MANDYFKTSDLTLIASLVYLGFEVIGVEKDEISSNKYHGVFENSNKLLKAVEEFFGHKLVL